MPVSLVVVLWGYRVARGFLLVMSVPFEHLDLVAVRVLNEEVTCEQGAVVVLEFAHVVRRHAELDQTLALPLHVVDDERDVPVAVAVRVRVFASFVPGEFDLVCRLLLEKKKRRTWPTTAALRP